MSPPLSVLRGLAAILALAISLSTASVFAAADTVSIDIVDAPRPQSMWGFEPATRAVAVGTWVTWSNAGQEVHTVSAVDGLFDSGDLAPSEGYSRLFDEPGTFTYVCFQHPDMMGKIVVGGEPPA